MASLAMKILRYNNPKALTDSILSNMVTDCRRPRFGRIFDGSKRRIGKYSFKNRLIHLNDLTEPWLYPTPSNDSIRTMLKKSFNFD
jgi:hypothetical protein